MDVVNLTKRYGRLTALDGVSFRIGNREVLGLIGPNGSGKTTLFECLAGVLPWDGGELRLAGQPLTPADRAATLFYLPDGIAPWPSQSVGWALDFAAGFFAGIRRESARRLTRDDAVRRFDLAAILDARIGTLSKGQRKRALLAATMLLPHPVLLLDEPFDGLDLRQSRDIAAILREEAAAGRTLFLSIHQISEAARVCDRFVLLTSGRVCGEGTLDELTARVAAQSGSAPARDLEEVFLALT